MKITFCSDVHLEFGRFAFLNAPNADVLVLAGDIFVASELQALVDISGIWNEDRARTYFDFITTCCDLYENVIFVMGNHEHYSGNFKKTADIIKKTFGHLKNFHLLDKSCAVLQDILFVGGTLWTDMNNASDASMRAARERMNDFLEIVNFDKDKVCNIRITPQDTIDEHYETLAVIQESVEKTEMAVVVVSHHAPSRRSRHPAFTADDVLKDAYSSDLDAMIERHPNIKLWIHGHTHKSQDYQIGRTRIVCNPRGCLGYERRLVDEFRWRVVDV